VGAPGPQPSPSRLGGYTLIEAIVVIVILSIVGLTSSYALIGASRIYVRAMPAMEAAYQADLSVERLRRDIRGLGDVASITAFTATDFTFDSPAGTTIAYSYTGGNLLRNGDLLARGVSSFAFTYWKSDGTIAATPAELHLVDVDISVQSGGQTSRVRATVFPRVGSAGASGGSGVIDESASEATAVRTNPKAFDLNLVSLSSVDLEIASFSLSASIAGEELRRSRLAGQSIWHDFGVFLPAGPVILNDGTQADRTIPAGGSPALSIEFRVNQSGTILYQLDIVFTDGSSASLSFTITW